MRSKVYCAINGFQVWCEDGCTKTTKFMIIAFMWKKYGCLLINISNRGESGGVSEVSGNPF